MPKKGQKLCLVSQNKRDLMPLGNKLVSAIQLKTDHLIENILSSCHKMAFVLPEFGLKLV